LFSCGFLWRSFLSSSKALIGGLLIF